MNTCTQWHFFKYTGYYGKFFGLALKNVRLILFTICFHLLWSSLFDFILPSSASAMLQNFPWKFFYCSVWNTTFCGSVLISCTVLKRPLWASVLFLGTKKSYREFKCGNGPHEWFLQIFQHFWRLCRYVAF